MKAFLLLQSHTICNFIIYYFIVNTIPVIYFFVLFLKYTLCLIIIKSLATSQMCQICFLLQQRSVCFLSTQHFDIFLLSLYFHFKNVTLKGASFFDQTLCPNCIVFYFFVIEKKLQKFVRSSHNFSKCKSFL